jgi:hypothetical protein
VARWAQTVLPYMMLSRLPQRTYLSVGNNRTTIYHHSQVIVCPCGLGRNLYRLGEILQIYIVLIFINHDFIWLPSCDRLNWLQLAVVRRYDGFQRQLEIVPSTRTKDVRRMLLDIVLRRILDRCSQNNCPFLKLASAFTRQISADEGKNSFRNINSDKGNNSLLIQLLKGRNNGRIGHSFLWQESLWIWGKNRSIIFSHRLCIHSVFT